ncbi:MAG: glycosyltransferase family 39 protein [Sediminibacterium sp.]|nr:glycosyltransferase family 39 protein [Sediminibacterium sp.]
MSTPSKATVSKTPETKTYFGFGKSDFIYLAGLGIIIFLIAIIRSNFLHVPFERDEGSYAYCGKIILNGAVPFKDIGSQRLPGVFYSYALMVAIFGYTLESLHFGFIFINILSTILLFLIARKMLNNIAALGVALFWAFLSMNKSISGFTIQSEHIVALFAVAGIYALVRYIENNKWWTLALSGFFFALTFEVKQTSFFYGLAGGIIVVAHHFFSKERDYKLILKAVIIYSLAIIIPVAIDLMVVKMRGGWEDFNYWFFDIRKEYATSTTFDQGMQYLDMSWPAIYKDYKFIWLLSCIGPITLLLFTKVKNWIKWSVIGFYLAGALSVAPGYHFYGHYFLQWVPAACIGAGAFLYSLYIILKDRFNMKSTALYVTFGLVLVYALMHLSTMKRYYFTKNGPNLTREVYGLNPFPESKVIADKLNTIMKPEDKLAVFGTEIQMYFYTNKISPSRFAGSGALLEFNVKKSEEWQQEFIKDVEKAEPKYLVFYSHAISWLANPNVKNLIFPWFDKFSNEKYNLLGYADMLDTGTEYVWAPNIDLVNRPPRSQYKIFIFERKPEVAQTLPSAPSGSAVAVPPVQ